MPRPNPPLSKFFCHPNHICVGPSVQVELEYGGRPLPFDLDTFGQEVRSASVIVGERSKYTKLFEDADFFIRVVTGYPLQVRTFLIQKNKPYPLFLEYPSQVPSKSFFHRRSYLLNRKRFTCAACEKTYNCFFYCRRALSPSERRTRSFYSQVTKSSSEKEDTTEGSKSSPQGGTRRGRRAVRRLVKKARKFVFRGTKWVCSKLGINSHRDIYLRLRSRSDSA